MSEQAYPAYVRRLLARARDLIENEYDAAGSIEAAALCFDVLALYPDHQEAAAMVLQAFHDPWLIRDNRKAIGRHIDEWDDRYWQQRRRLALSYRFMSRWEGKYREYDEGVDPENVCPSDVKAMLEEGKGQLIQDYLLGQTRGSEMAWSIFQAAFKRTRRPQTAMLWVGDLYADQGYFAESVDVLETLLSRFPEAKEARRLWAEVRWWRDNQHHIPWIPPATHGDGRRYRRMMTRIDPDFATDEPAQEPILDHIPPDASKLPDDFELPEPIQQELIARVEEAMSQMPSPNPENTAAPGKTAVDWRYLEMLETGDIDVSQFPEWAQYMLLEIDDPQQEEWLKQFLLNYLSNPPVDLPPPDDDDDMDHT